MKWPIFYILFLFAPWEIQAQENFPILNSQSELRFIENRGQIGDLTNSPRPDVLFQIEGQRVFLRNTGISIVSTNRNEVAKEVQRLVDMEFQQFEDSLGHERFKIENEIWNQTEVIVHQIDMNFLGCNPNFQINKINKSLDYCNYYLPQCPGGVLSAPHFSQIEYRELYEGINAVFYGQSAKDLKYDFIVAPKANPGLITLEWIGADSVYIDSIGTLVLVTRLNNIYETIPLAFQIINGDTVKVDVSYDLTRLINGEYNVKFNLGEYDKNNELIIDPWVTNYGGSGQDGILEIATDNDGDVYVAGWTSSMTSIAYAGFQLEYGESVDAMLVKFNEAGDRVWATYYGGDAEDQGAGVAVDSDNNVYLCGKTKSNSAISDGGFQNVIGGNHDAFLVKFNSTGARLWATYYGGEFADYSTSVKIDGNDNVYMSGTALSTESIAFEGYQMELTGYIDAFIVKFDPSGDRLWATYYGGSNGELIYDLGFDQDNNVFATGVTTSSELISSVGSFQEDFGGGQDAFLVKFNEAGDRIWGTYFGSLWVERGDAVVADTSNNIYIAGKTTAPTATSTPGAFQTENGGISDAFLAKFTNDGERLWSTYLGGDSIDYAFGIGIDKFSNNVVVSGEMTSDDFPVSVCAYQSERAGIRNSFVTQFLPDGELFCSSLHGVYKEDGCVLAINNCDIYLAGVCSVSVATPGAFQEEYGGGITDFFVSKLHLSSCGMVIPETTSITQSEEDVTSCSPCNGSLTVDVADFCMHPRALKSYNWSNGESQLFTTDLTSTIDSICEGEYWVEVMVNCEILDTFFFEISSFASISANFDFESACVGEPIEFTNTSFTDFGELTDFEWIFDDLGTSSDTNPVFIFDEPGFFDVELTSTNDSGCEDTYTVSVEVFPNYNLILDTLFCEDALINLPNGDEFHATVDTLVSFIFETVHGCDSLVDWDIAVSPQYYREDSLSVDLGASIIFPDGSERIISIDQSQTSFLLSGDGCDSIIVTNIYVKPFLYTEPEIEVYLIIPNIFTPNADGSNKEYLFPNQGIVEFKAIIVNRWGVKVAEFNDVNQSWSGADIKSGINCMEGVYFITYMAIDYLGNEHNGQGNIQLVR